MTLNEFTIVALVIVGFLGVLLWQRWRINRLRFVLRADREQLLDAWGRERELKRQCERMERDWKPGYSVSELYRGPDLGYGDDTNLQYWVFDNRDTCFRPSPVAVCTSPEASRAALRLLQGGSESHRSHRYGMMP